MVVEAGLTSVAFVGGGYEVGWEVEFEAGVVEVFESSGLAIVLAGAVGPFVGDETVLFGDGYG
jgi:hypothetical protein